MTSDLSLGWARFKKSMTAAILPFWTDVGFLEEFGHYCECTSLTGRPIREVPLRSMVQARQIFVFADAERTGIFRGGGERALEALDVLLDRFSDGGDLSRGVAFSISLNGRVASDVRDSYAHAFLLLALASAHRLSQQVAFEHAAEAVVKFIDDHLADKQFGGVLDSYPQQSNFKLQNPNMHLLEAYLAMHEAWPVRGYLERAGKIVELFRNRIFRPNCGVLLEQYFADWSTLEPPSLSAFFEPGHLFEWAWLLQRYDALANSDHRDIADSLWRSACTRGVSSSGFCFDQIAFDPALSKHSHRTWPHTEGIKAATVRVSRGGHDGAAILTAFLDALNSVFLARAFPGGWLDRIDSEGNPLVDLVPASTLYHLYSAFVEASRIQESPIGIGLNSGVTDVC